MQKNDIGLFKKIFASRFFLVGALLLFIVLSLAYVRAYYQNLQVRNEIDQLQAEAGRLTNKKFDLNETLQYVKSAAYVEEKARTELNLIKAGENVAVIEGGRPFVSGQSEKRVVTSTSVSIPREWWNYFFNHN